MSPVKKYGGVVFLPLVLIIWILTPIVWVIDTVRDWWWNR